MCFNKTQFPRVSCKTNRANRRSSRSTISTRDDNLISVRLCHTCGNRSYTYCGDKLHSNSCFGIDLLQVKDKLCQILDRINIMMRRRRDKRYPWFGKSKFCNKWRYFRPWKLSTLPWFCPLCNFDLYLCSRA